MFISTSKTLEKNEIKGKIVSWKIKIQNFNWKNFKKFEPQPKNFWYKKYSASSKLSENLKKFQKIINFSKRGGSLSEFLWWKKVLVKTCEKLWNSSAKARKRRKSNLIRPWMPQNRSTICQNSSSWPLEFPIKTKIFRCWRKSSKWWNFLL